MAAAGVNSEGGAPSAHAKPASVQRQPTGPGWRRTKVRDLARRRHDRPADPTGAPARALAPAPAATRRPGGCQDRFLYGFHAVRAAWLNPERECLALLATEGAAAELAATIAEGAGLKRPRLEVVDRARLERLLPGAVHQGVALEVRPLPEVSLDDLGRAAAVTGRATLVVLDQVTDPHNVGAVLRSAAAFGAAGVVLPERNTPEVTGVLAKAASGAVEHVPLVRIGNLARAIDALHGWDFWTVGLAEEATATLAEVAMPEKVALVMGAEGTGLRHLTRETCRVLARLPTAGPIASLNVSNAAAIALYERVRQAPKA